MITHIAVDSDIERINAAMQAEKLGHVLDGWRDDNECRCMKCTMSVQVRDGIRAGDAIFSPCPYAGNIFTALKIRNAREQVGHQRLVLHDLAEAAYGPQATPEGVAQYNAALDQYGKLYSAYEHAIHAGLAD